MPSRFVVRHLRENCVYHIFNKSSHERGLFLDTQDFRVFLFYLYIYTNPIEEVIQKFSDLPMRLREKTLSGKLDILAYTLMPDHFHLVIKQRDIDGMPKLMKQVINGYTVYYNQKYKHQGSVFLGRYKATEVPLELLTDMVRYLHNESGNKSYEWSSYQKYLGNETFLDCNISEVMNIFSTRDKFVAFHEDTSDYKESLDRMSSIMIEALK